MFVSAADLKNQISLKAYAEEVLEHTSRGELICPCCASGTGPNHTPAFSIKDDIRWKCFSCGEGGDIFDLAKAVGGISDFSEARREVERWYLGDGEVSHAVARVRSQASHEPTEAELAGQKKARARSVRYIHGCRKTIEQCPQGFAYMRSRGFTDEETRSFGVGYNSYQDRIVIPWSTDKDESYHIDRCIGEGVQAKYIVPSASKTGQKKTPYHLGQATQNGIIWTVEGLFDAMSIDVVGGHAMALCGTAWRGAVSELTQRGYDGLVIVSLDRDAAGVKAGREMYRALKDAGIYTVLHESPLPGGVKDMNEALAADRDSLGAYIQKIETTAVSIVMEAECQKQLEQSVEIAQVATAPELEHDVLAPEPEQGAGAVVID